MVKEVDNIDKFIKDVVLHNGDCLSIMKSIPDNSVSLILCDLPYGTTMNKWDNIIPLEEMWELYKRIITPNGAIVLHAQEPFTSMLVMSNLEMFKYKWIWNKKQVSGFLNAKKQPLRNCEDICVFYSKQCVYNPQMRKGKMQMKNTNRGASTNYNDFVAMPKMSDEYYPTMLLDFPLQRFKGGHPTQKPVPLLEYLVKTYTNEGDTVLDNCMGSGSTGVACVNTGRKFIGIEINDEYFKLAKNRLESVSSAQQIGMPELA